MCVCMCVYRWKSTKLGRCATRATCHVDGPAVLKSLVSKFSFFFSFGLGSRDEPTDRPFRFILDYEFVIFIARPGTCDRRGVGYLGFRCDAKRVNI